jgi:hypothetical protein
MKITIEHETNKIERKPKGILAFAKSSTFETYYKVKMLVELSQEERAILAKNDLWDTVVGTKTILISDSDIADPSLRDYLREPLPMAIKNYVDAKGYFHDFATSVEARAYEQILKTKILPQIKEYIMFGGNWKDGPETFEL